jgi:hypothetical protein
MTDKQIIIEKGNQKCIFYNDDICRKGDRTRDCLNCARVEYHSLYKLNWENQERLESQLEAKEQECEELRKQWEFSVTHKIILEKDYKAELDQLKAENEELKNFHINLVGVKECEIKELVKYKQALTEIKEIAEKDFSHTCWLTYEKQLRQILQKCEV